MKQMKKLSVLAAGSIAIGLQLFTSMALAEEVCLDGDTVVGIKGLDVVTDEYGASTIDVKFTYATGYDVYGSGLDKFPFNEANKEEDLIAINGQINESLDANNPTPGSAGQPDQSVYFVGAEEDEGLIGAYGSENLADIWEQCTQLNECIIGVAILNPSERHTYAELSKASGSGCDGASGPSFNITPGITGSWFDVTRDGEGFNFEIWGSEIDPQFLAYFYTYDDSGNQMWLTGTGPVNADTSIVDMTVTSGTEFGPGFDPGDVIRESWGTITFKFSSCNAGTAEYTSTNFGNGTFNISRITSVTGLTCP